MATPGHAFTIARAAEILGEDEELLWSMLDSLEPEDGCFWLYDTDDRQTVAFIDHGLECLRGLIREHNRHPAPPRP